MNGTGRRGFLQRSVASVSVGAFAAPGSSPDDRPVNLGVIGCGGMGSGHLKQLAPRKDVKLSWVCDVDQQRLAAAAKIVTDGGGRAPKATGDMRDILDDAEVEAVLIATPDHWHTPAAVLAMDAGKHVYVEKPCCHNLREGRLLQDTVKRTGMQLQVGTQSRSTGFVSEGIERVLSGEIGEVLVAKAWNSQRRGSIGKTQPSAPPEHLDFDTWLGPAPAVPYRSNMLHAIWRWWYNFGCGDIGNDGVHDIDVALWGLGVSELPSRIAGLGGLHFFDDDQQFPDTQYAVCEYPSAANGGKTKQLIFEQRTWSPYVQEGYENGAAFYGTQGLLVMGHTKGWKLYGPRNKLIAERTGAVDLPAHHSNFLAAVRDADSSTNADVLAGVLSAGVVHLANIAARTGQTLEFDPTQLAITSSKTADAFVMREYREHWGTPRIL